MWKTIQKKQRTICIHTIRHISYNTQDIHKHVKNNIKEATHDMHRRQRVARRLCAALAQALACYTHAASHTHADYEHSIHWQVECRVGAEWRALTARSRCVPMSIRRRRCLLLRTARLCMYVCMCLCVYVCGVLICSMFPCGMCHWKRGEACKGRLTVRGSYVCQHQRVWLTCVVCASYVCVR